MKLFLDSADVAEIRTLAESGMVDGITTNPSSIAGSGREALAVLGEICRLLPCGPVSAEVIAEEADEMVREGKRLAEVAENIVVKVPVGREGLVACQRLRENDIRVNVTLCFSGAQALLAAKAGATYISPFIGRLEDCKQDGIGLVSDILSIYRAYPAFRTQVLAASIRNCAHVTAVARLGTHAATIPPGVFGALFSHPLTTKGIRRFLSDWKSASKAPL